MAIKPARPSISWYRLKPVFWMALFSIVMVGVVQLTGFLTSQAVNKVVVAGELRYVDKALVIDEVRPFLDKGFIKLELSKIQQRLEMLPWIYSVQVSRRWPSDVVINIVEQQVIAQWSDEGFLNHRGELFLSNDIEIKGLPQLDGPTGSSLDVMKKYRAVSSLLRDKDLQLKRLSLAKSGAWVVELNEAVIIEVGRDLLMEKMRRFTEAYEMVLVDHFSNIKKIDMRYSNGLAVAWREKS